MLGDLETGSRDLCPFLNVSEGIRPGQVGELSVGIETGLILPGGQFPDQGRCPERIGNVLYIGLFFGVGDSCQDIRNSVFGAGCAADGVIIECKIL